MKNQTNERALEAAIEKSLTGYAQEELREQGISVEEGQKAYRAGAGFYRSRPQDFDAQYALDTKQFWAFLEATQAEELALLKRHSDWKLRILQRLDKRIRRYGLLRVLRQGLAIEQVQLTLFYELPQGERSEKSRQRFEQNCFSIMRQVRYSTDNPREEIDVVLFVNGLPIATMELKNPWTGQHAANQGIRQYEKRDWKQPLLQFGRCLVHFAVDTDEAYMTTRLKGKASFFLPFNKGYQEGSGNPPNPEGYKTAYLWEEVFTRYSLANLIQHFVRFDGKPNDTLSKRTLYFPRYHQLDVVRRLIEDARTEGVGKSYLIQHSAGSGKSNSMTWAAYQLIETYPANAEAAGKHPMNRPLFDTVIVVTDRRLLDKQLRENIQNFSQVGSIVAAARSSRELKQHLEQGKKIITTTIQKFPFIVEEIGDLSDQRFAVLIDEAHSSQTGISASKMNAAMGGEEEDAQDIILRAIKARKVRDNASYMAFTATPKNATLERFGQQQSDGSFRPFHLYSMKQAIEEGFILDVLANYTTYRSYYELQKSVQDNPEFDSQKAQQKLRRFVENEARTIATKAEVMLSHFMENVYRPKKLKGKAKGMVLTQSIESAIRYYLSLRKLLKQQGEPFKILIAFSGNKTVDGVEYTEAGLNGFSDKETRERFDTDEYRLLVVANKYLTGFDQPKLCVMYVDKRLQGVLAVQALSRLNRSANKLGKRTEDLFVLDFFNSISEIQSAFEPFYTATTLREATDVNVLNDLEEELSFFGVYEQAEVERFSLDYFSGLKGKQLSVPIDKAAARFNTELPLKDAEKADFKIKAKQFVKIYAQVAAMLPYEMRRWEQLFWFLKFLIPKLKVRDRVQEDVDSLLEKIDLSTYGLERKELSQHIQLEEAEGELAPQNANPRSAHAEEAQREPLDVIIEHFNARYFENWEATPEDRRAKFLSIGQRIEKHKDFERLVLNNNDQQNRRLIFEKIVTDVMRQHRQQDMQLYKQYATDKDAQLGFINMLYDMLGVERRL